MPILAPTQGPPPPPPPAVPTLPAVTVSAGFGATGGPITWTDISAYVRSVSITRGTSRLAGPLYQYQAATATIVLKNGDGRFDPANLSGPYTSSTGFQTVTQSLFASQTWTAPHNMAGATIRAECWGGGGGGYGTNAPGTGNGAGAAGGGEYAAELTLAVTAGTQYQAVIGTPGAGGSQGQGGNGGTTTFAGDTVTVTAHGGQNGASGGAGGAGGSGSVNTVHFNGGHGGSNTSFSIPGHNGGAGGGGSGTPTAAGLAGTNSNSDTGAPGAQSVTDGGPGGNGGGTGQTGTPGRKPSAGPGGGGGGGWANSNSVTNGGAGYQGRIRLTYTVAVPAAATVTQVLPMVPVQVQATWTGVTYSLFTGYANAWADAGLNNPRYAEITLTATDAMYVLTGITLPALPAPAGEGEDTGARISRVLDAAGWPAASRNIDPGDSALQGTSFGDTALNLCQVAADTEVGEFYVDGGGLVTFRRRSGIYTDPRSVSPQVVLGDRQGTIQADGTEQPYTVTVKNTDDTMLFNDVQNTRVGGTLQEAVDQASISRFQFPRTYARSDLLQESDSEALNWAQYVLLLATQVQDRFDTITLNPMRDTATLYPQALGREIGDLTEVWRRPPGVATPVARQAWIRGIDHTFDASSHSWTTVWTLQNAGGGGQFGTGGGGGGASILTLDDPVKGKLDFNSLTF